MSRGRGRGRGRGKGFEIGLAPGEPAPPPILQPPPLFPVLDRKPLELESSQTETEKFQKYLLPVKQELKQHMLHSPFHLLRTNSNSFKVARYSDKYRRNGEKNREIGWQIEWNYFPKELQIGKKSKKTRKTRLSLDASKAGIRKRVASSSVQNVDADDEIQSPKSKKPKRKVTFDDHEGTSGLDKKLEGLEKAEQLSAESEQSAEEENVEEEYEDEEEEGTDYNLTYFDNGEDDIGEDDTLEEGPVY